MKSVLYEHSHGVAVLTLNEPGSMNALSETLKVALAESIEHAMSDDSVRCLLITGSGNAFCAGGDLRAMSVREPLPVRRRMHGAYRWARQIMSGDKPVVGAINGAVAGAGYSLALMCDVIVASDKALFVPGFTSIGAVPDLALAYTLQRAVGMPLAKDILLTGRKLNAREAMSFGLVSRVFDAASFHADALAIAHQIASGPASLKLTKALLNHASEDSLEAFLDREAITQAAAFGSNDFDEGLRAFSEKRSPVFRGD